MRRNVKKPDRRNSHNEKINCLVRLSRKRYYRSIRAGFARSDSCLVCRSAAFGAAFALDVGAGTGRDASWLARKGYEVVAVEPSTAMRNIGQSLHTEPGIQWIEDALPDFRKAVRLGLNFDFILLSAVWMHVAEVDRSRAFRKLITLLKPGGFMALSLRIGGIDEGRAGSDHVDKAAGHGGGDKVISDRTDDDRTVGGDAIGLAG